VFHRSRRMCSSVDPELDSPILRGFARVSLLLSSPLRASSVSIVYFPARFTRSVETILSIVRELSAQPGEKIHSDIPERIPFLIITSCE